MLVADGSGENISTSAWAAQGLELTKLWDHALPDSLGWFYSAFTEYLGFMPNRHEGKLMGLAAYGRPRDEFVAAMAEILPIDGDGFRFEPSFSKYGHRSWGEHFSDRVVERFGQPRSDDAPFEAAHHDLAWAVQDRLEQALSALARRTPPSNSKPLSPSSACSPPDAMVSELLAYTSSNPTSINTSSS